MHFYWVTFSSFLPSCRSGQCVTIYFISRVKFLYVFIKLEVSITVYKFSGSFFSIEWQLDQYWEVLSLLSEKFTSQEVFPVLFMLFPSLLLDCTVFSTSTFVTLRFGLFMEVPGGVEHFKTLLILELLQIFNFICFTACIQLVKISTIFLFLGRCLLVKNTES